ncbi:hypothetical protein KR018_001354 [Drosophila ironensis]|nr:hypothetical protein KR018_001354 [Drosophila ironensis]
MGSPELAIIASLIVVAGCQLLPENTCPTYFQYVNDASKGLQGEVSLPGVRQSSNFIYMRFSQKGVKDDFAVGNLQPYPPYPTGIPAQPLKFRLALQADKVTGVLPKLTYLSYNDQVLCTASEYAPTNTNYNRYYQLSVSEPRVLDGRGSFPTFPPFTQNDFDEKVQSFLFNSRRVGNDVVPPFPPPWSAPEAENRPETQPVFQEVLPTLPARRLNQRPSSWPSFTSQRESPPVVQTPAPSLPPPPPRVNTSVATPPPVFQPRMEPPNTIRADICGQEGKWLPFIYMGEGYNRGKYPWLTAVYDARAGIRTFICGGSLISANMIITAAHCVYKKETHQILLELGRYDLYDFDEDGAESRNVKSLLWHPEYNSRTNADADVALVTMQRPVTFNDIISPICLWTATESTTVATSGFVTGWGKDETGLKTQYPRVVEAAIATATECVGRWKTPGITDRTLCAGNRDGSGPCAGDSGGGLMVRRNDRWLLRAIVSVGEVERDKCKLSQYVLYCDLAQHLDWINANLR